MQRQENQFDMSRGFIIQVHYDKLDDIIKNKRLKIDFGASLYSQYAENKARGDGETVGVILPPRIAMKAEYSSDLEERIQESNEFLNNERKKYPNNYHALFADVNELPIRNKTIDAVLMLGLMGDFYKNGILQETHFLESIYVEEKDFKFTEQENGITKIEKKEKEPENLFDKILNRVSPSYYENRKKQKETESRYLETFGKLAEDSSGCLKKNGIVLISNNKNRLPVKNVSKVFNKYFSELARFEGDPNWRDDDRYLLICSIPKY